MKGVIKLMLIIVGSMLVSCSSIQPLDFKGVESVKMGKLSKEGVDVNVKMKVGNPNKMKFKIKRADLDVTVAGVKLGKAQIDKKVVIPKKSEDTYSVTIKSKFSQLLLGAVPLTAALKGKRPVNVKIDGSIKVKALFISKKFPVSIERKVNPSEFGG